MQIIFDQSEDGEMQILHAYIARVTAPLTKCIQIVIPSLSGTSRNNPTLGYGYPVWWRWRTNRRRFSRGGFLRAQPKLRRNH